MLEGVGGGVLVPGLTHAAVIETGILACCLSAANYSKLYYVTML